MLLHIQVFLGSTFCLPVFQLPLDISETFLCPGCIVAQAVSRWLPPRRPGFASGQSMWGLWWTKRHWGRISPSTSVSPANHHSTHVSIIIITRGWHNRPIGGHSAEWTQLDSNPHYTNKKKIDVQDLLFTLNCSFC
jgi:hypothetical protein